MKSYLVRDTHQGLISTKSHNSTKSLSSFENLFSTYDTHNKKEKDSKILIKSREKKKGYHQSPESI